MPVEELVPGKFYLFSGDVDAVILGCHSHGGSLGIPLTAHDENRPGYKAVRIDPSRCLEIAECRIELAEPLKMQTGVAQLRLGAIAISATGASIAVRYNDWNDLGWMTMETGEINPSEFAFRHFFTNWSLTVHRGSDRYTSMFTHQ